MPPRSISPAVTRSTPLSLALLALTIALGLASRTQAAAQAVWFPDVVARYAGDVLWASMVFWWLCLLRPSARTSRLASAALAIAVTVECSQRYHAPWIDAIRATRVGALVLGHGFLFSDLACYAAGVVLAVLIDSTLRRARRN